MDSLNRQEQLDKILKYIADAGEKNISEKRKNFEHLTLLVGTILGFSVGLVATTNGDPDCFLVLSWVADVVALIIGSAYLILETEGRYFRTFVSANKQVDLVNIKTEKELREAARTLLDDARKLFLEVSSGNNLKEKTFILFTKYQPQIEIAFYITFVLSLILLIASFL